MDEKKAYWFEQPYMPQMKNIAVAPVILEDGRLSFCVPGDDYFEFQCDDEVMHRRGGTYKFHALDVDTFSRETCQWISQGKEIADCCKTTEELHEWYLKHWTYNR